MCQEVAKIPSEHPRAAANLVNSGAKSYFIEANRHVDVVAGVDLGGTAINYTLLDEQEKFLIEGLCEHPARVEGGTGDLPRSRSPRA